MICCKFISHNDNYTHDTYVRGYFIFLHYVNRTKVHKRKLTYKNIMHLNIY